MARHGESTREVQMQSAFDWAPIARAPQTATADYSQTVRKAVSQHAPLRSKIQRNHNGEHVRHKLGGER